MIMGSAEAELIALVKRTAESMDIRAIMRDEGREMSGLLFAGSSAALAIANRKGPASESTCT